MLLKHRHNEISEVKYCCIISNIGRGGENVGTSNI